MPPPPDELAFDESVRWEVAAASVARIQIARILWGQVTQRTKADYLESSQILRH
jgi:hypothetical protein